MKTKQDVISAIGDSRLELVRGSGYHYFVFDGDGQYETKSLYIPYFNSYPFARWVREGQEFLASALNGLAEREPLE